MCRTWTPSIAHRAVTLFLHDLLSDKLVQFLLLLLLLLLEYLSVVFVKKAITFSSKIFQTLCFYLFFRSCCCCYFNARWVFHFLLRNSHQFTLFANR